MINLSEITHFRNGLNNNYPLCCILWFISNWNWDNYFVWLGYDDENIHPAWYYKDLYHVPCPNCMIKLIEQR